jgi:hypothetical protein
MRKGAAPGQQFLGWFYGDATRAFNFQTLITSDITLTARWGPERFFVFFRYAEEQFDNWGGAYTAQIPAGNTSNTVTFTNGAEWGDTVVELGSVITPSSPPMIPVDATAQKGFRFRGWYHDDDVTPFDFINSTATEQITLVARYDVVDVVKQFVPLTSLSLLIHDSFVTHQGTPRNIFYSEFVNNAGIDGDQDAFLIHIAPDGLNAESAGGLTTWNDRWIGIDFGGISIENALGYTLVARNANIRGEPVGAIDGVPTGNPIPGATAGNFSGVIGTRMRLWEGAPPNPVYQTTPGVLYDNHNFDFEPDTSDPDDRPDNSATYSAILSGARTIDWASIYIVFVPTRTTAQIEADGGVRIMSTLEILEVSFWVVAP